MTCLLPHPCPAICVIAPSMSHLTSKQVLKVSSQPQPDHLYPCPDTWVSHPSTSLDLHVFLNFIRITSHSHLGYLCPAICIWTPSWFRLISIQVPIFASHLNPGPCISLSAPPRSQKEISVQPPSRSCFTYNQASKFASHLHPNPLIIAELHANHVSPPSTTPSKSSQTPFKSGLNPGANFCMSPPSISLAI